MVRLVLHRRYVAAVHLLERGPAEYPDPVGRRAVGGAVAGDAAGRHRVAGRFAENRHGGGDAWTNLIQPFWALPALAIAGLKAKDVMGFCLIVLIVTGVVVSLGLLLV
jgi:short-chain fatty acids transporter